MRVQLANDEVIAGRVVLAALIAGDDTRRDTGAAHQRHERRRIVFTKTAPGFKQELVHRIVAEQWRFQGCKRIFPRGSV